MSTTTVRVFSAEYRPHLWMDLRRLITHREVLFALVQRDLKVRYRQTLLGILWAAIPPFALMVVFNLFFGRFSRMPSEGFPYPIFAYAGLLPWTYFTAVTSGATASIIGHQSIITKVAFPREFLPWVPILGSGVDFLVGLVLFGGLLIYFHTPVAWTVLFILPLLGIQIIIMAAVGLVLAVFNAYYRDVRYLVPLSLQVLLFASPVIYSVRSIPEGLRPVYFLINPMAIIIESYRQVILRRGMPDLSMLGATLVVALVLFTISYRVFKRFERNVADVV